MDSVVIVGSGVLGASLAWRLARAGGVRVTLVDQFGAGDPRASSGGESRLIRCAHGEEADYTASARRARTLWRELEAEAGIEVMVECGTAWFAYGEEGWEAASARTLVRGLPRFALHRRPAPRAPFALARRRRLRARLQARPGARGAARRRAARRSAAAGPLLPRPAPPGKIAAHRGQQRRSDLTSGTQPIACFSCRHSPWTPRRGGSTRVAA